MDSASSSLVSYRPSASQEIPPPPFIETEGFYSLHKTLPLNPNLSQFIPVHVFPKFLDKIRFNLILPSTSRSSN